MRSSAASSGQPEIVGYTPEYLDASSPRRQQIEDYLARADQRGAAAAQIAAHQTRDSQTRPVPRRSPQTTSADGARTSGTSRNAS